MGKWEGGEGMQFCYLGVCMAFEIRKQQRIYIYFNELSRGIASYICGMPPVSMCFLRQSSWSCKKAGLYLSFGMKGLSEVITSYQKGTKRIQDFYRIISKE